MPRSGGSAAVGRIALDTSAYSRLMTGDERVEEDSWQASEVLIPAIVLGELEAGSSMGRRRAENARLLESFLDEPFVQGLDVTRPVAQRYGTIVLALPRAGTPIPVSDAWIAATAIGAAAHLLTFDRAYERVPGLSLTVYQ